MEEVRSTVLSCIISQKGGIPLAHLNDDYKLFTGRSIPFRELGFKTLEAFLNSLKEVSITSGVVRASSARTANLEALINKQKTNNKIVKRYPTNKHPKISQPQYRKNAPFAKHKNYGNNFGRTLKEIQTTNNKPIRPTTNNVANFGRYRNVRRSENEMHDGHSNQSWMWEYNHEEHMAGSRDYDYLDDPETFRKTIFELSMVLGISALRTKSLDYVTFSLFSYIDNRVLEEIVHHKPISHSLRSRNWFINRYQVIGDGCMYHLLQKNYGSRKEWMGTCDPTITLKTAQFAIADYGVSKQAVICCGTLDIHMNISVESMITQMQILMLSVVLSGCEPIICTLPPSKLPNLNERVKIFNDWLSSLLFIRLIPIHTLFLIETDRGVFTNDKMFQEEPSWFIGYPYHLWSYRGREAVKDMLDKNLYN
ncbi:uncharacterized protein LOC143920996 [Arctopsyche grandis]|uniref:uncharacterized protein LOC143920996 n=1 Tax=Arctopsyche grandis TaxID=121162 RepID=UPI00406D67DC